ncbi:hypothetical protein BDZ89DRAFT_1119889, partial [Hymenopellis radicata]
MTLLRYSSDAKVSRHVKFVVNTCSGRLSEAKSLWYVVTLRTKVARPQKTMFGGHSHHGVSSICGHRSQQKVVEEELDLVSVRFESIARSQLEASRANDQFARFDVVNNYPAARRGEDGIGMAIQWRQGLGLCARYTFNTRLEVGMVQNAEYAPCFVKIMVFGEMVEFGDGTPNVRSHTIVNLRLAIWKKRASSTKTTQTRELTSRDKETQQYGKEHEETNTQHRSKDDLELAAALSSEQWTTIARLIFWCRSRRLFCGTFGKTRLPVLGKDRIAQAKFPEYYYYVTNQGVIIKNYKHHASRLLATGGGVGDGGSQMASDDNQHEDTRPSPRTARTLQTIPAKSQYLTVNSHRTHPHADPVISIRTL